MAMVERMVDDAITRKMGSQNATAAGPAHVIISLHGIETHAPWQKRLDSDLSSAKFTTEALEYGKYLAIRMVSSSSRRRMIEWFVGEYAQVTERHPGARISIIAHSFGTYITANAMRVYPQIKFDTVVFCGSIVETDFPWTQIIANGQVKRVLNEYGGMDFWAGTVANFVNDAGPSGRFGFEDQGHAIQQRHYPGFRHSDYFKPLHYRETWIPFLGGGEPGTAAVEHVRMPNALFQRTRRYMLYGFATVVAAVTTFVWWRLKK